MNQVDVGIYLPANEPYCKFHGGALSTWTREVYGRIGSRTAKVFASAQSGDCKGLDVMCVQETVIANAVHDGIRQREFWGLLRPIKGFLRTRYASHAGSLIGRVAPVLIHIHNDPEAVVPIRRHNPGAVIVLHMNNDHLIEGHIAAEGIGAAAVAAADWVACCSSFILRGALAAVPGLQSSKCFVLHNGADLSQLPLVSPAGGFKSAEGPVLLFIGRVVEQKGLHLLIEAMSAIRLRFPSAKLKVVGGVRFGSNEIDPYLATLRVKASTMGDAVEFMGPMPHDQIAGQLALADVFVCPSIWNDPFPLVVLEAMAAGVPVVAFAKGGIPEAVGDAGVLIHEITSAALAEAIRESLSDQVRRSHLATLGLERVKKYFSWDVIARQWEQRLPELAEFNK